MRRPARADTGTQRLDPPAPARKRSRPPSPPDRRLSPARPQLRVGTVLAVAASTAVLWWVVAQSRYDERAAADPLILVSQAPATDRPTAGVPNGGRTAASTRTAAASTASRPSGSLAAPTVTAPAPTTSTAPAAPAEPGVGQSTSWQDVLQGLDAERAIAFGAGDPALLTQVYAAGSAPLERDVSALVELRDQGLRAVDLALQIERVTVVSAELEQATLRVVDRLPPYRIVDTTGSTVQTAAGRGLVTWVVTLAAVPDGWRISDVVRE